jgi:hypothetical protein
VAAPGDSLAVLARRFDDEEDDDDEDEDEDMTA